MASTSPTTSTHDHGTKAHADVAPGEIAVGVVIGRASEYFDFFVFGIASALIFPAVFFPFVDRLEGTLWSFALFALAFVARPFGTMLSMKIQARWGRGLKLTVALFLLGTGLYLFSLTALGILLATVASSMPQFGLLAVPVFVVMYMLSGSATPFENMPMWLQHLMQLSPSTHYVQLTQGILYRAAGVDIVWPQMLAVGGIGIAFLALALMRFRSMLARQG